MDFDFKGYFRELQRRHVVKAGLAYLVMSWLLLQVLDVLLPVFGLGETWMKAVLAVLSVGFPIWLIIAWVYDFSPQGIKKTEDVPFDPEISRKKNIGLNRFIIGGLAIAVILLVVNTFRMSGQIEEFQEHVLNAEYKSSIAVLALADISPNQDQQYFSDGLSRSIYDQLARYKDLKVISPTSSFYYKDKDVSFDVIAEELGVAYILEGSVQRYGDSFRVSINLVNTSDGATIWSKTFDDQIEDILETHDEIATAVAKYLKLTLDVPDVQFRKVDPQAYELYLRADDTLRYWTGEGALAADSLIRESLKIDPAYSQSQSTLSMTTLHRGLYFKHYSLEEAVNIGLSAAEKAIALDSNNVSGYLWLSNWQWHGRASEKSEKALNLGLLKGPNTFEMNQYLCFQRLRQNRLTESLEFGQKAIALNPKFRDNYVWTMYCNIMLGNFDEAESNLLNLYKYSNDDTGKYGELAYLYLHKGDLETALEFADRESHQITRAIMKTLIYIQLGDDNRAEESFREFLRFDEDPVMDKDYYSAIAFAAWGRNDEAFERLNRAHDYITVFLEWFFTEPSFRNLYDDPRWDAFINRLSDEFHYEFPHRPE